MAKKSRMSVLKRQREAQKRQREKRKAEKQELKRERRHGKAPGTAMASREDLVGLGILQPEDVTEESGAEESSAEAGADEATTESP